MKHFWIVLLLFLLLLGACSGTGGRPSNTDVEKALSQQIPAPWQLKSFNVSASENTGTKVEPVWQFRFKASANLAEDTFVKSREIYGAIFLKKVSAKGDSKELFGIATSTLREEKWQASFQLENNPFSGTGMPRSAFQGKTVVEGTTEEKQFRDDLVQKIESKNTPDREQVARALIALGDDRGKKALSQILVERVENINTSLMNGGNTNVYSFCETIRELGQLGQPEAVPSILHAYKYQGFGDTARSCAQTAIRQIGKPGVPYLERGVSDLQKWYFSPESRAYHKRVYNRELTDAELSNISWGPKYVGQLLQEIK